jgi:dihydroorotate dehydrogenase
VFFGAAVLGAGAAAAACTTDAVREHPAYLAFVDGVGVGVLRFALDAEAAHDATIALLKAGVAPREPRRVAFPRIETGARANLYQKRELIAWRKRGPSREPSSTSRRLETTVWGMRFPNPVGLAAGFDKQAQVMSPVLDMGFGFLEVGGVTPLPQAGNPKPRLFRLDADGGIINRFGLNSQGLAVVRQRLELWRAGLPSVYFLKGFWKQKQEEGEGAQPPGFVGVNLARNTVQAKGVAASDDYVEGIRELGAVADFFVVNVSCPNVGWTKGLNHEDIRALVRAVVKARDATPACMRGGGRKVPVLLKIGPDYSEAHLKQMAALALDAHVDGVVVSNTSSLRPASLQDTNLATERGGLSGKPIKGAALSSLRLMYQFTGGAVPLVGVGGIWTADDAYERIRAGASLIEIYSAMTFQGPGLVQEIKRGLDERLMADGFESIAEAVGADVKGC